MAKRKDWRLIQAVLENSISEDWDGAIDEWDQIGWDYVQSDGTCACGKQHISELNFVRNRFTGIELIIGSECINKFFNYQIQGLHASINKVIKEPHKSLHMDIIRTAYHNGIINQWEKNFYLDVYRKQSRSMSYKQIQTKESINSKILNKIQNINDDRNGTQTTTPRLY